MTYRTYVALYKLRFLFVGMLVVGALFVALLLASMLGGKTAQAKNLPSQTPVLAMHSSGGPNVIANGMFTAAGEAGEAMDSAGQAMNRWGQATAAATTRTAKLIGHGVQTGAMATVRATGTAMVFTARTIGSGVAFVGRAVGSGIGFVFSVPGRVLGAASNTPVMNAVIRPDDPAQIPIIDPNSPELQAAVAALAANKDTGAKNTPKGAGPVWPIHGEVTAAYGVPHYPYQPIHTGIDISDHRRAGKTPIRPFRPGKVIDAIYSRYGFGNHVIVDHGSGVTSLYGHLNSISVKKGQKIGLGTTLGYEGTTGMSTGVHLHFEIRVNGQAADPRRFISGRP